MIEVLSVSALYLTNEVGIQSRSHVLVKEDTRIFSTSSSDICVKEDKAFYTGLGLVTGTGGGGADDDCMAGLTLIISSLKKYLNMFARSTTFV